jgi:hypothetical protein
MAAKKEKPRWSGPEFPIEIGAILAGRRAAGQPLEILGDPEQEPIGSVIWRFCVRLLNVLPAEARLQQKFPQGWMQGYRQSLRRACWKRSARRLGI